VEIVLFWTKIFSKKTRNKPSKNVTKIKEVALVKAIERGKKIQVPLHFLQKLEPIRLLTEQELNAIEVRSEVFEPGQILYKEKDALEYLAYVVKGEVFCENSIGTHYEIVANTFKALYPLFCSGISLFTAIAKTKVTVIYLPKSLLLEVSSIQGKINRIPDILIRSLTEIPVGEKLIHCVQQGKLDVPSFPDVAIRLRTAVQKDIGSAEAVKIVNLDPVIAAKLIQIVNSPLYRGVKPFTSCDAAVNRLGLITTRNLVTSISMQSLFKSQHRILNKKIHEIWQQSIKVSSLAHTLAVISNKVDPEEALLAGLTHNIGVLPIINLVDQQQDVSIKQLDQCIKIAQGYIGQCVLSQWGFAESLVSIPYLMDNWFYDSGSDFSLVDVVLLAKYHSLLGTDQMQLLPALHELPAFRKLGDSGLTPDMSLQVLYDAKQQVTEAMTLFEV